MNSIKVLVTNQKGGVGKSTISANIAGYLSIKKNQRVSLIDFDRQASSAGIVKKTPGGAIQAHKLGLTYEKNSGLTLLEARAALRNHSKDVDITIADLTWTYGMSHDFLLDFDVVIIPSSLSQIEMASTEIFILEYIQKNEAKFYAKRQYILVAPSRIDPGEVDQIRFAGIDFLQTCFVCPPIMRIPNINKHLYKSYFCDAEDPAVANSFTQFCEFVMKKIALQQLEEPITSIRAPEIPVRRGYSEAIMPSRFTHLEPPPNPRLPEKIPVKAAEKDSIFHFIPSFLRKK